MVTKIELQNVVGEFTWLWTDIFFVETFYGNFIWSSPGYGGDNTFTPIAKEYQKYIAEKNLPYGRSKGRHIIKTYCGEDFSLKEST